MGLFVDFSIIEYDEKKIQITTKKNNFSATIVNRFFANEEFKVFEYKINESDSNLDGVLCLKFTSAVKNSFYLTLFDPQIKGGTLSIENLKYLHSFLEHLKVVDNNFPFLLCMNSGGFRITQSRTIFNSIWGIVPALFELKKKRLFLSIADEICIGASAVFFGQGHLRIASDRSTIINLTGGQVIKSFFGQEDQYSTYASAAYQFERHLLVHEVTDSLSSALDRATQIMQTNSSNDFSGGSSYFSKDFVGEQPELSIYRTNRFIDFLRDSTSSYTEVMPNYSNSGMGYICKKDGRAFGLLINPLDHPNNAISVGTIEKYSELIDLFAALRLPLLVVTDTPGADPRKNSSEKNIIIKSLTLIDKLINYSFFKVGLIAGRCYGGSGLFALPSVHGSAALYALENSKIGSMSEDIIEQMIKKNTDSYVEWKKTQATYDKNIQDMVESGNIKKVIKWTDIPQFMDLFLSKKLF